MPRPKSLNPPSYLLHKPTGQARVRIAGKDYYLGPYGSEDSRRKYGELVAQLASGRTIDPVAVTADSSDPGPSVAEQ
ncbi:MAG: hypothetical protein SH850_10070 [Planctomycetaceae bacterium]|nr:hypothetical protein [Planctomycetaceae bacterium]